MPTFTSLAELHDDLLIYHSNLYFVVMPLFLLILLFICVVIIKYVLRKVALAHGKIVTFCEKHYKKTQLKVGKIFRNIAKEIFIEENQ